MNTKLIKILLAGAVLALVGSSRALATGFSGSIAFDGTVTLNNPIPTATAILSYTSPHVSLGTQTGAYAVAGIDGTAVTMQPFIFSPFVGPVLKVWDFWYLGVEYSFDLYSPISVVKGVNPVTHIPSLTLDGNGIAHIGLDSANGAWELTTQGRAVKLSFSAFSVALPDGGTTALLLGFGLLSVGLAVRRSKSVKA
jgi:hypothetical protein